MNTTILNLINYNIINDINILVYENPFITRQFIIDSINLKYKIKLSLNYISKMYKKLKLTRKKPKYHVVKTIEYLDNLIIKREEFKKDMSKIDLNKIISIDESSFNNLNNNNSRGLSKKGKPINLPCNEKKIKNHSLICAVTVNKIIHYEIHNTSVDSEIFYNYINKLIKDNKLENYYFMLDSWKNNKHLFIIFGAPRNCYAITKGDNVRFNHSKKTLALITDTKNHYIFTPPYSPNNNPIEIVFGIIKNKFNKIKKEKKLIKVIIISIIEIIKETDKRNNKETYKDIFERSINYDYKNIEKELRYRLIIKK